MEDDQNIETGAEAPEDKARRRLLKLGAWIPPAVVASVTIGANHAVASAWSDWTIIAEYVLRIQRLGPNPPILRG